MEESKSRHGIDSQTRLGAAPLMRSGTLDAERAPGEERPTAPPRSGSLDDTPHKNLP